MDPSIDRIALARAFDLAWAHYEQHGKSAVPDDVARIALAKYLVTIARTGPLGETELAERGIEHLKSLEPPAPEIEEDKSNSAWTMQLEGVRASMVEYWRVTFVQKGF